MVFSSVPIYMDPSNWNQQPANHQADKGNAEEAGMSASAAIRPGSMAERARLAKIPQPEPALKCPRCDSNNTKFCYFNNYSLTQPRHFCKTCLRYWTRGGALRNVPVGGGCRRNKRISKAGGSSKSHATTAAFGQSGASSSSSAATSGGAIHSNMLHPSHLPFISPSFNFLADYGTTANLGLNFSGMHHFDQHAVDQYQIGSSSGLDQWRIQQIQQFPFMGGMEAPPPPPPVSAALNGLFHFDSEIGGNDGGFTMQVLPKFSGTSGLISQLDSVKMEDNQRGLSLPKQSLGLIPGTDQYWGSANSDGGGDGWSADLSGFNASSSGNLF